MVIITANKRSIYNFDRIENIYVSENCIKADTSLNNHILLGIYTSNERAEEIFNDIIGLLTQDNFKTTAILLPPE